MRKKIDFLNRLFAVLHCRAEILEYLKLQRLITDDVMVGILHENHNNHATKIAGLLEELVQTEKIQLLTYEWTILPKEHLCLTILTETDRKEFVYSV